MNKLSLYTKNLQQHISNMYSSYFLESLLLIMVCLPYYYNQLLVSFYITGIGTLQIYKQNKNSPPIELNNGDIFVITFNYLMSLLMVLYFIHSFKSNIYEITSYQDISSDDKYIFLFSGFVQETLFYFGHRLLHRRELYPYIHKMHHKFKITNYATSFYAHPLDQLFLVSTLLTGPYLLFMMNYTVSITVMILYLNIFFLFFINSHQLNYNSDNKIVGTKHYIHHRDFIKHYGNMFFYDIFFNTSSY